MRKAFFIIIIISLGLLFGAGEPVKYLWLGVGARTLALGNTGVAIGHLAWSPYYNPSSVSEHGAFSVAGGNQFLALGRRIYFASLASEISDGAGVGITWIHSSVADVECRDVDGNHEGIIDNSTDAIYFSFAKRVIKNLHAGVGIEYIQSSLENVTSGTAGLGMGLSYRMRAPDLSFGLAAQNLFMELTWNSNSLYGQGQVSNEAIPFLIRMGTAYTHHFGEIPLMLSADIWYHDDSPVYYGFGAEILPLPQLAIRAGFTDNRPSAGVGIQTKIGMLSHIGVNYTIVAEREGLAPKHLVDITVEY